MKTLKTLSLLLFFSQLAANASFSATTYTLACYHGYARLFSEYVDIIGQHPNPPELWAAKGGFSNLGYRETKYQFLDYKNGVILQIVNMSYGKFIVVRANNTTLFFKRPISIDNVTKKPSDTKNVFFRYRFPLSNLEVGGLTYHSADSEYDYISIKPVMDYSEEKKKREYVAAVPLTAKEIDSFPNLRAQANYLLKLDMRRRIRTIPEMLERYVRSCAEVWSDEFLEDNPEYDGTIHQPEYIHNSKDMVSEMSRNGLELMSSYVVETFSECAKLLPDAEFAETQIARRKLQSLRTFFSERVKENPPNHKMKCGSAKPR